MASAGKAESGAETKGVEVNLQKSPIDTLVIGEDKPPDRTRLKVIARAASLLPDEAQAESGMELVQLTLFQRRDLVECVASKQVRGPLIQDVEGATIWDAFQNAGESMLIVGPPGSGKGAMLSQLGHTLIDLANINESDPVPIMLSLSSWREEQREEAQPKVEILIHWLAEELRRHYVIGTAEGPEWIKGKKFALLDGR